MPYTLMKGLAWILLALLLGIVIGWLLRSVVAKRQVTRARNHHVDTVEMEKLRGRIANLEPIVAERDRLRAEIDTASKPASTRAVAPEPEPAPAVVAEPLVVAPLADLSEPPVADATGVADGGAALADSPPPPPDVSGAAAVLGRSIALDDLKVIEGVGPKIEDLCHGIGITTWHDVAGTEVSLLRTMLADAGPRFRTHDPASWPEQARLLAEGRWAEFKALVDTLDGGRAAQPTTAE